LIQTYIRILTKKIKNSKLLLRCTGRTEPYSEQNTRNMSRDKIYAQWRSILQFSKYKAENAQPISARWLTNLRLTISTEIVGLKVIHNCYYRFSRYVNLDRSSFAQAERKWSLSLISAWFWQMYVCQNSVAKSLPSPKIWNIILLSKIFQLFLSLFFLLKEG